LAAQSLTNREIAQTLLTARTVEGHLTSVFRKLQLASRDELTTARAERAPAVAQTRENSRGVTPVRMSLRWPDDVGPI
jgi:hypothetical protein